jgi:adenine-specific DNA-methyltransferase
MTESHTESTAPKVATEQPENLDLRSHDISRDKQAEIFRLFPEVRTEGGKIDFDHLKRALGETLDPGKERYGMNWPGKADCFKAIQQPSVATLRPLRAQGVNADTTGNVFIEGDNLEVLKLLQKPYLGKIKMIYLDPPFNTGNEFIYPDNYTESLNTYLEYTGQVDAEGRTFSTNTEADGRFHSKWLNMMYPRLYLARNLLRDNGVIMISIDDHEVANLRRLCDEIFGEENFLITLVWQRRQMADSRNEDRASTDHEYVVCYKRQATRLKGNPIDKTKYSNPDNDPRGPWFSADLTGIANKEERPNLHYDLVNPETGVVYPPSPTRGWGCAPKTMSLMIEEKRVIWPPKPDGRPRHKKFLNEVTRHETGFSSWLDVGQTTEGTKVIQDLFGEKVFPFAKPMSLLEALIDQGTEEKEGIILDFFAGSGTTGHAVMSLNEKDGGNRKFILVQLPEPTGRADYRNIAEIGKERIRRAIKKLNEEDEGKLGFTGTQQQDRGFMVYSLDESNFTLWNSELPPDEATLERQLELHVEHIRRDRTQDDLLYEILLKSGFDLTTRIEPLTVQGKQIYRVAEGAMLLCLEQNLTPELIKAMADMKPQRVICLDAAFADNDQVKTNAVQIMKSKGVTSFRTV